MKQYVSASSEEIGKRIKEYRLEHEWTSAQMGEMLSISGGAYNMKERGKRDFTWDEVIALSDIFDVSLDEMIRGIGSDNVDIHRKTGLSDKAIDSLDTYNMLSDDEKLEGLSKALSYMEVMDALSDLMNYVPEKKGYFLSHDFDANQSVMTCIMSPEMYVGLLEQNLLRVIRLAKEGKRPSWFYSSLKDYLMSDGDEALKLAEPSEFKGAKKNGRKK